MGTRADFYVGKGEDAEWLGSVAWDGYEWADGSDPEFKIQDETTEEGFRKTVAAMIASRDDGTKPEDGWPWPWDTSEITDFAYYFENGKVAWDDRKDWPDMSSRKKIAGGNRSGLMVFTSKDV